MTRARDLAAFVSNADGDIKFDTDTLFIDSSANKVGIGTDSPNRALTLEDGDIQIHDTGTSGDPLLNFSVGGTQASPTQSWSMRIDNSDSDKFQLMDVTDSRIVLTADGSGNVGIGDDSPDNYLNVKESALSSRSASNGNTSMTLEHATDTGIQFFSASQVQIRFGDAASTGAGSIIYNHSDDSLRTSVNGSERVRYYSTGEVKVGENLGTKLGSGVVMIERNESSNDSCIRTKNPSTNSRFHLDFHNSSGTQGNVTVNASSVSYNSTSDHRKKENVNYTWDGITNLKLLKPAKFNFIGESNTIQGFLAHEAATVVPEAVTGTHNQVEVWGEGDDLPDGVSVGDNKLDDDGNTIPVYQSMDSSKLVPLLTKALQEAITKIETLETENTAIKARLDALEAE